MITSTLLNIDYQAKLLEFSISFYTFILIMGSSENNDSISYRKKIEHWLQGENELSVYLTAANDLPETLQFALDSFCSFEGIDAGAIYLVDQHSLSLDLFVHHGSADAFLNLASHTPDTDFYRLMESGKAVFTGVETIQSGILKESALSADFLGLALLPMTTNNRFIGCTILVSRHLEDFEPELQHILLSLSHQVSLVTGKLSIEAKLGKMREALDQIPEAVVITDTKGDIEYINLKFTEITGYTSKDVLGKNPRLLKSGRMLDEEYKIMWDRILSGKMWKGEFINRKKNGDIYWESASIYPIADNKGKVINFIGIKEDITYKKTLQEQLIKAKKEIEESGKIKSTLINSLSHELRTPLTEIQEYANFLKMEIHNKELLEKLNVIMTSGEHLINVLDSIITLAQIDSSLELDLETFDIVPVLNKLLAGTETKLSEKGANLHVKKLPDTLILTSDRRLLTLALEKIIENSVECTVKGSVSLNLSRINKNSKDYFEFTVHYTGRENKNAEPLRVYYPFITKSSKSANINETGSLSLDIASRIIKLLKGNLEFHQNDSQERKITVNIPWTESRKNKNLPLNGDRIKPEMPDLDTLLKILKRQPSALLVEDNEMNALLVQSMLRKTCKISLAKNGELALDLARKQKFDFVLMDINLGPGLNGMQVTQEMKKINHYVNVPFAAVTGYTLKEEKEKIRQSGINFFLGKPFKKEELFDVVRKMVYNIIQEENSFST